MYMYTDTNVNMYLELPGSSVLRGAYFRLGLRSEVLANSITGPPPLPPTPPTELVDGDELVGTLTLFNASLYFLNINVRFLVAITKSARNQKRVTLFLSGIDSLWIWGCCGGHVIEIGEDGGRSRDRRNWKCFGRQWRCCWG